MSVIKLDLDTPRLTAEPFLALDRICQSLRLTREKCLVVRSTHGWHVTLWVTEWLDPREIVAIQLCAGSDPKRELFNLQRIQVLARVSSYWRARWNVLYTHHIRHTSDNGR